MSRTARMKGGVNHGFYLSKVKGYDSIFETGKKMIQEVKDKGIDMKEYFKGANMLGVMQGEKNRDERRRRRQRKATAKCEKRKIKSYLVDARIMPGNRGYNEYIENSSDVETEYT